MSVGGGQSGTGARAAPSTCMTPRSESAKRSQVVTAFGDRRDAAAAALISQPRQLRRHRRKGRRGEPHAGERILLVRVESRRHQHEVGLELTDDRHDDLRKHQSIVLVDGARLERKIHRESGAAPAADLVGRARSRILGNWCVETYRIDGSS